MSDYKYDTISDCLAVLTINLTIINSNIDMAKRNICIDNCHKAASRISEMTGLEASHELMLELTRLLDEHPDGWEGACECSDCMERE